MKKRTDQYPAILKALSIKDLSYAEEQYSVLLPSRVANHSTGFRPSCPITKLAIIVIINLFLF